jgi:hypothetical protein
MTSTDRITRTLTLSYVPTADLPSDPYAYAKPADQTSGVTLIPDDLTSLGDGMERAADELAPLMAMKQTADFTFEYVSGISEQPIENSREPNQSKVPMKTYFWRQVQSAEPLQVAVKLSVKALKKEGAYADVIETTPTNDLSKPMFAFKVMEMMTSCGMEPLADELVSYVGVGKSSTNLLIDSAFKTSFGGFLEFNTGCPVLRKLNDSLPLGEGLSDSEKMIKRELIRGRYIANKNGRSIIKQATGLRRSPTIRGPANCGNPIVGGEEVLYESAGYWYNYGMYGSPDSGKYAQERDDQDAVVEFPVD